MKLAPAPTLIRGTTYPSRHQAARALGLASRSNIARAESDGWLDRVGLGRAKPVTLDGVTYPSLRAASRATGIPLTTLHKRLRKQTA